MIGVHEPIIAIKGVLTTWKMTSDGEMDIQTVPEVTRGKRMDIIRNRGLKGVKINVVLHHVHCTFVKTPQVKLTNDGNFHSWNQTITEATDLLKTL